MGGDNAVLIEIIIFAMIAAFLVHRLRSVLGRRTGDERPRPNPFSGRDEADQARDNVVQLPTRNRADNRLERQPSLDETEEPQSLSARIDRIRQADPDFDEKNFLGGSRMAFQMIVDAFARGDLPALRPLLADDVFKNFSSAVAARRNAGETLETRIVAFRDVDLADARLDGSTASLTVRFVTEQTNVTRNRDGAVIDGDADHPVEIVDLWTFARDARSRDPNWALVETRAVD